MSSAVKGLTPKERYSLLHNISYAKGEVVGPLGIPGWKRCSKATAKWMIEEGKWESTEENLKRAGMAKAPRSSKAKAQKTDLQKLEALLLKAQKQNEKLKSE
jgi:hypothetical protein